MTQRRPWVCQLWVVVGVVVWQLVLSWHQGIGIARADFFTQIFTQPCTPLPDPPPSPGWLRWSSAATWRILSIKVPSGVIPGVGRGAGMNVTIPCGRAVLLDVSSLNLTYLDIRGFLKVEDAWPMKHNFQIFASFISVEGKLAIGQYKNQFRSKITFTLTPNPNRRQPLSVSGTAFPNKKRRLQSQPSTALVGHKAFAVVGGQVSFHGMPGGRGTPSWVRLSATAMEGQNVLQVDQDVSSWPVSSSIAISSTDYYPDHAEEFKIVSVKRLPNGNSRIILDGNLTWRHMGVRVSDGMGGTVDERAEVALLSRNIVITGQVESGAYALEGGHFIVHQTAAPQIIEGVEFWRLGQQGTLGKYNIHFHVCGDTQGKSVVYKNSIHDSNQRCVVVHATHNLTIDSNVAYNTSGHCYIVEEGGEQDNTFINNLGFLTTPVIKAISATETDKQPSTFWISNIRNNYIGNVAGGSSDTGMWFELRGRVRGMSVFIPELAEIQPLFFGPGGTFSKNTVHSNQRAGLRTYPHGLKTTASGTFSQGDQRNLTRSYFFISNFLGYKHRTFAIFTQATLSLTIQNSTFADNGQGIYIQSNSYGKVRDCRFVGLTSNIGTPPPLWACQRSYGPTICAPVHGCLFPPTAVDNVRSMGQVSWTLPTVGILISGIPYYLQSTPNAQLINNRFSGYDPTCRPAAGVGVGWLIGANWWDAATAIHGIKTAANTPAVWFPPSQYFKDPSTYVQWDTPEALSRDLALRDMDGSIVGGAGGYVLANYSFLIPPSLPKKPNRCKALPHSNAVGCPGVCYRTVVFKYFEPGFVPFPDKGKVYPGQPGTSPKKHGDYSYLILKRNEDGATRVMDGNLNVADSNGGHGSLRWFYVSLLAGATYDVIIHTGKDNSFWPQQLFLSFADGWGSDRPCSGSVALRIFPKGLSRQWAVQHQDGAFWSKCPGVTLSKKTKLWPVLYNYPCYNGLRPLLLRLLPTFPPRTMVTLEPTTQSMQQCKGIPSVCGVVPDGDTYQFKDSPTVLPNSRSRVLLQYQSLSFVEKGWKLGRAPIGFIQYFGPTLRTKAAEGGTVSGVSRRVFYFRRKFTLSSTVCHTGMVLQYYPITGLLVYLNGREAFRFSLPPGPINASTWATNISGYDAYASLVSTPVINFATPLAKNRPSLRNGVNLLAYELHLHNDMDYSWYFDSTVAFTYRC